MAAANRPGGSARQSTRRGGGSGSRTRSSGAAAGKRGATSTAATSGTTQPTPSRVGDRLRAATTRRPSRAVSTRRFAVLAVVVCALVLTLAVPLRTYVAQRQELAETLARQDASRAEVAALTERRDELREPGYVRSEARERLRYVMPGDTPYQVQLPDAVERDTAPGVTAVVARDPWYSELWGAVAAPVP